MSDFIEISKKMPNFKEMARKYVDCPVCNSKVFNINNCPICEDSKRDKIIAERKKIEYAIKFREKQINSGIKERFFDANFSNFMFGSNQPKRQQHLKNKALSFINNEVLNKTGKSFMIIGEVGNGKTFTAICMINHLLSIGKSCYYTKFSKLNNLAISNKQEFKKLEQCDLLVVDEMFISTYKESIDTLLSDLIDDRWQDRKSTVFVGNINREFIKSKLSDATYSRLFGGIVIETNWNDLRKELK